MIPFAVKAVLWVLNGGWRYLLGAAAVLLVVATHAYAWRHGYAAADTKCEARALRAQVDKLKLELKAAHGLAESAKATLAQLQQQDVQSQERMRDLYVQIDAMRSQPAGKPERAALLDARCGLTRGGVRFFSR
ncbi:MAG: hypothetical protein GEU91_14090 [Rhizobiales bacterium]|nr:hypothetical protein [Hyphomicrobiales bacterium]